MPCRVCPSKPRLQHSRLDIHLLSSCLEFRSRRWAGSPQCLGEMSGLQQADANPPTRLSTEDGSPSQTKHCSLKPANFSLLLIPSDFQPIFHHGRVLGSGEKKSVFLSSGGSTLESCENASQEIPLLAFQIHQLESSGSHPRILGSPPDGNQIPDLGNCVCLHFRPLAVNPAGLWCEVSD